MAARRSSSKLAGDLKAHERRLVELRAEQDRIAAAFCGAAAIRDQAADAELRNDLAAAERLRADVSKLETAAGNREKELASLVPRLEALIASTKEEIERATFEETLAARDAKAANAAKLARGIASALKGPLEDAYQLAELRAEVDALDTQAREMAKPLGAEVQAFEDEPTFGDQETLDFLQAGARQLNAETQADAERQAARWAKERPQMIERAVRAEMGSMVPTRLGPIARLESEALRRDAIEAFAKAAKRAPERARPSYEEHLKELREISEGLAENAEAGGGAELGSGPLPLVAA
jgi:hypothetical protein